MSKFGSIDLRMVLQSRVNRMILVKITADEGKRKLVSSFNSIIMLRPKNRILKIVSKLLMMGSLSKG